MALVYFLAMWFPAVARPDHPASVDRAWSDNPGINNSRDNVIRRQLTHGSKPCVRKPLESQLGQSRWARYQAGL